MRDTVKRGEIRNKGDESSRWGRIGDVKKVFNENVWGGFFFSQRCSQGPARAGQITMWYSALWMGDKTETETETEAETQGW